MSVGKIAWKLLRWLGNVLSFGLYQWLKNKYGDKD